MHDDDDDDDDAAADGAFEASCKDLGPLAHVGSSYVANKGLSRPGVHAMVSTCYIGVASCKA